MIAAQSIAEIGIGILVLGIISWWVVEPKSYIACIRKVPWLWMSTYPLNTKPWFPRYLRLMGLFMWAMALFGLYCWRFRLH
jgi:hypothetical protein